MSHGSALLVALLTPRLGFALVAPAGAADPGVPASQPLVVLMENHVVRTSPDGHARGIELIRAVRPLTRVRTVLPVLGEAVSANGKAWVRVRLPGRPNGHNGWISTDETRRKATEWHVSLDLSTRRLTVYRAGRADRRFSAVIGTRATPTPTGRHFIEEAVALSSHHAGGPFALATSARSNVLQEFAGGPGQIALHGTRGLSGALGSSASHGCIRLSTRAITWLAGRIGSGVPLTITR
jgi:lipoprotein-anchoring transpeptidase ErfK/SrfK